VFTRTAAGVVSDATSEGDNVEVTSSSPHLLKDRSKYVVVGALTFETDYLR
jgi:hypothetical protein